MIILGLRPRVTIWNWCLNEINIVVLLVSGANEDAINAAREDLHSYLSSTQKGQTHAQDTSEEELAQMDERELEAEFAGVYENLLCLVNIYNLVKTVHVHV